MESEFNRRMLLWTLLGPFCFVAFMGLLFAKGAETHAPFAWVALLGLPLCYQGRIAGLGFTFLILLMGCIFYFWKGYEIGLWEFGLVVSLALTFTISSLSYDEVRGRLERLFERLMEREHLEEQFNLFEKQVNEETLQNQLGQLLQEQETTRQYIKELEQSLVSQEELKQKVDALEEKKNAYVVHETVVNEMSDHIETISREKGLLEKTLTRLQIELEDLQDNKAIAALEGKLSQLREQFQEKSEVLSSVRKELFLSQEKVAILQKEIDEVRHFERNVAELALEKALIEMEEELKQKEEEIDALHDIVSTTLTSPTSTKF